MIEAVKKKELKITPV